MTTDTPLGTQDLWRAGWIVMRSGGWWHPSGEVMVRPKMDGWEVLTVTKTIHTIDDLRNLLTSLHVEGGMP